MEQFGLWESILVLGGAAVILIALATAVSRRRSVNVREESETPTRGWREDTDDRAGLSRPHARLRDVDAPRLAPESERPSEDEIARAHLGGTRGSPELPDAPMTPQRAKKTPHAISRGGHTA